MDYRQVQEDFVSNHTGSSYADTAVVIMPSVLSVTLIHLIIPWYGRNALTVSSGWMRFLAEFCVLVFPQLAALTVLSANSLSVVVALLVCIIFVSTASWKISTPSHHQHPKMEVNENEPFYQPCVTHFRAGILFLTVICILAVDFPVFPRKFAKTEVSGYGLMDVGVGLCIISNSIVCPQARGKKTGSRISSVLSTLKTSIPVIIVGLLRLIALKAIGYHEHNSEYGHHWNFFFTLAVVQILASLILVVIPDRYCSLLSVAIITLHQYFLDYRGLKHYIIYEGTPPSSTLGYILYANRGGIHSCFGYLSIYFAGVEIGKFFLKPRKSTREWIMTVLQAAALFIGSCFLLQILHAYVDPVSRRLANVTYVVWMVVITFHQLALLLAGTLVSTYGVHQLWTSVINGSDMQQLQRKFPTSLLPEAVNRSGFLYFLLANLSTGIINMSMKTLFASTETALIVITAYLFLLKGLIVLWYIKSR